MLVCVIKNIEHWINQDI